MNENQHRTKSTIYLGADDRERIASIRKAFRLSTDAASIRKGLELATSPLDLDLDNWIEVLQWAGRLQFMNPRERAELHDHTKNLYEIVSRQAASQMPAKSSSRNISG